MSINGSQFVVSMKFLGINELSPEMKKMADDAKRMKQQVNSLGAGPSGGFKWMNSLNKGLQTASTHLGNMEKKLKEMKSSGFGNLLTGVAVLAPVMGALNKAGDMQTKMTTISAATGATNMDIASIQKAIREASSVTKYSSSEVADLAVKAATSGMSAQQVRQLTPIMAKFAEVQQYSKGTGAEESVTNAISASHMLGLYDPKQLDSYLNQLNKATMMMPGSSSEFFDTFKYLAPAAKGMGMNNQDILDTAILSNRVGLMGSMGGTESADMILRSIPGIFGGNGRVDKNGRFKPSKQLGAMMDLGLAQANGSSAFFNDKGQFLGIENFIDRLSQAAKKVNPEQLTKDFKDMFGMQGMRMATILSDRGGEQLQIIKQQMASMKSFTDTQIQLNKNYRGQADQLRTNLENLQTDVGTVLLPTATSFIHALQPLPIAASEWISAHKGATKQIAAVTAGLGAFLLVMGTAKIAMGTLGPLVIKPLTGVVDSLLVSMKVKSAPSKALAEQMIRASVVNVYGAEINNGGLGAGGGTGGGGKGKVKGGALVTDAEVIAKDAAKSGLLIRGLKSTGSLIKGAAKRGGNLVLPATIALSVYDVATAPEGHKVETAARASGNLIGGWAGAEAGLAIGAGIGSIVPGFGTVIGGALGAAIGGIAGSMAGDRIASSAYAALNKAFNPAAVPATKSMSDSLHDHFQKIQAIQKGGNVYHDNSTHTYHVQTTDPHQVTKELSTYWNMSKKSVMMANTSG